MNKEYQRVPEIPSGSEQLQRRLKKCGFVYKKMLCIVVVVGSHFGSAMTSLYVGQPKTPLRVSQTYAYFTYYPS